MYRQKHPARRVLILVLLVLATGACKFVLGPSEPEKPTPTATPRLTATPAPTTTPKPTPTNALPYPPPRLIFRTPEPGASQPPDAPIELTFDQPMDHKSVNDAFAISPNVKGELAWSNNRTLVFTPAEPLSRGAHYRVAISNAARNAEGTPLVEPVAFDFSTVGYLEVSEVQPLPGSEDVAPDTTVTLVFNRPVVPLTALSRQDELPAPLTFVPPVRGDGEWLNTSIYRFRPTGGFQPATQYKARVAAGFTDTTGNTLEDDYTWIFSTVRPEILGWSPIAEAEHVGPSTVISVTFNQPMDHTSTEAAFALDIDGRVLNGTFRWEGGATPLDTETMTFTPADPLPREARPHARIAATARARYGDATLPQAYSWYFYTVKNPGIISTTPFNGETNVSPYSDVSIHFASPMQRAGFMAHVTIIPEPTKVYTYWGNADTEVRLSFALKPATVYNLTLDENAPDKYGALLGTTLNLRFTTGDLSSYASLNTGGRLGTFNAYTKTVIYVGYRNISRLDATLYRLSPETFMMYQAYGDYKYRRDFTPPPGSLVRTWSVPLNPPRNEARLTRLNIEDADGAQLPPGIYYVELTAPEVLADNPKARPERYTFIRSRVNLTLKQAYAETLVWATDLATGQPVAHLPLRFHAKEIGWHDDGSTGTDGLYVTTSPEAVSLWDSYFAFAGVPGDDNFAVAYNDWDNGVRPWSFKLRGDFGHNDYVGYVYTDRPIYRPGQTVYFKGIVRADDDANYTIPAEITAATVRVSDPQGKELYNERLDLNAMGTLHGELALDDLAPLGTYYVQVQDEAHDFYASTSFRLAEYRKPEFQVDVATDRDAYLNGDTINLTTEATYYFGGPVADATVNWRVLSSGYSFRYICPHGERCPAYDWTDYEWGREDEIYGSYGKLIAEGEATTRADGRITARIPADIGEELSSRRFTLEATVTDINNQTVSNRTAVIVHKGEFYIGLAPRGRVAKAGEEKAVDILTVDWDSQPVAAGTLDVVFMEHRWYNVRQQAEDGNYYWTWTIQDTPIYTTTVTTDETGKAVTTFTPPSSGSYKVLATGEDARGNEIRSSTYVWVWGGGAAYWRQESTNRIDLITDKDEYRVGDVAEILIPSPYSGTVQALVTIERGHIIETEVRELHSNTEILRIPIEARHAPNIFVSVILVQGSAQTPDALASFKMGEVMLPVSIEEKELTITLTPDRPIDGGAYYRPRETAIYDVLVTDHAGKPVEAELSLRLADLAVLALADESGPTLLERFWSRRGLSVRTALPLVLDVEAHNRELAPRAKGGGGGGPEDGGFVRTKFADTAFWDPVVRTGPDGRARVEVPLPDNLTTWRMQARGLTVDTRVGRAEADVISTLDLLVRPLLPRFFVVGDRAEIATIVHNNTDAAQSVQVNLTVEGLQVRGATQQSVNIPAGDKAKLVWPVTILPGNIVTVRMEARAGDFYDGREDTLPVYHYSTPEVVGTAGRLSEPELRQEIVQLPRDFDPTQGELTVRVDGSLTGATADALDYLEHYPYECVEQTVSRFLPNVLTIQVLDEMGIERPGLREKIATQVNIALQRLYAQQHYDGGWGWWRTDASDTYLTAYVLQGLLEAHRAGFTVDQDVVQYAVDFLRENLPSITREAPSWQANRLAYQLYVLAEYVNLIEGAEPAGELGTAVKLFENRHLLGHYGRAMLAVALGLLEPEEPARVDTLLSDLNGAAIYSATGTHWEEAEADYWNMNTDVRTTATVLWALARHDPESDLLPNIVRWLMDVRQQDSATPRLYWESTHTTSWVLTGLVAYMRATGELRGEYDYTVTLNGAVLLEGEVNADNIDESQQVQVAIAQLLVDDANRLVIERHPASGEQSGAGQLYYTAHLRYFLPVERVQALDRGIIVARQYSPVDDPDAYVDGAEVGDVIRVKLTVIAPTDLYYVVVEDPLPAGCEAVDVTLNTTSVTGERPEVHNLTAEDEDVWYRRYGWGWWWFSHAELRDEKVALFASYLPRGVYEYSYLMLASVPGTFNVIPATAYEMYFPEVFGRSDGGKFVVVGE